MSLLTNYANLRLRFVDTAGKERDHSFRYIANNVTGTEVNTLGTAMTNNPIFKTTYASLKSAELVITTTTPISGVGG